MFASFRRNTHALVLREIRSRLGNNPLSLLWVLAEPMLHISVIVTIKVIIRITEAQNLPTFLFVVSGIIPFFAFRKLVIAVMNGPRSNKPLLSFPGIKTFHIITSRSVLDISIYLILLVLVLIGARIYGYSFDIRDLLMALYMFGLLCVAGIGMGLVLSPLAGRFHFIEEITQIVLRVMYFTSGVFFSLDYLPYKWQLIVAWNPIVHMISFLRDSLFFAYHANALFQNFAYANICVYAVLFFGLIAIHRFERLAYEKP